MTIFVSIGNCSEYLGQFQRFLNKDIHRAGNVSKVRRLQQSREKVECLRYAIHRGADDPSLFVVVKCWRSNEDLQAHLQSVHVQKLFQTVGDLVDGAPDIVTYEMMTAGQKEKRAFSFKIGRRLF